MKSKKSIYILLPLVLIIWGMLIYQFFSYTNQDEIDVDTAVPSIVNIEYNEPDTTAIDASHRDPFTGKLENSKSANKGVVKSNTHPMNKDVTPQEQVQIEYKGIVTDVVNKNKVFMLLINNQTFLMTQGDIEKGIELISGNNESILIKHRGKKIKVFLIE